MRKRVVLALLAAALTGAVFAVGGVLVSRWWVERHATDSDGFWYAYSGPRRFVDYLPGVPSTSVDWPALLVPAAVAGAAVAALVLGAGLLLHRRLSTSPAGRGSRVDLLDQE